MQLGDEQPKKVRVCLGGGGEELLEKYFHQGIFKCELRVHNTKFSLAGQRAPSALHRCLSRWV